MNASWLIDSFEPKLQAWVDQSLGSASIPPRLAVAAKQLTLATGAKRVRPRLIALVGHSLGAEPEALVPVAVAAELLHTASLLHDDVVDESHERRHRPTVNATLGNSTAVLAGDWLLATALNALTPTPPATRDSAQRTVQQMAQAAVWEVELRGVVAATPGQWRMVAEGKTGALFAFCAEAAARAARPDDLTLHREMARLGQLLGVAFQRADDLKDLFDPDAGKPRFADLSQRALSSVTAAAYEAGAPWAAVLEGLKLHPPSAERVASIGRELMHAPTTQSQLQVLRSELIEVEALTERHLGSPALQVMRGVTSAIAGSLPLSPREEGKVA